MKVLQAAGVITFSEHMTCRLVLHTAKNIYSLHLQLLNQKSDVKSVILDSQSVLKNVSAACLGRSTLIRPLCIHSVRRVGALFGSGSAPQLCHHAPREPAPMAKSFCGSEGLHSEERISTVCQGQTSQLQDHPATKHRAATAECAWLLRSAAQQQSWVASWGA